METALPVIRAGVCRGGLNRALRYASLPEKRRGGARGVGTTMTLHDQMIAMGDAAREAAHRLAGMSSEQKDRILLAMADGLDTAREALERANEKDLAAGREAGLSSALLDRLELTDKRIDAMVAGIRDVAALADPVGETLATAEHASGFRLSKVRVPIGVIGIVFESRPNVTADAAVLCIKAGNAVILRGGKEALHSNRAISEALLAGGAGAGLPEGALQLVQTIDRDAVRELVQMEGRVDLIIPRGGEGLIRAVTEMARVPVIKHYKGVCHTYVDASADVEMALAICENAKCQRPGVCNAMETLIVHEAIASSFLPRMAKTLVQAGVELRGDAQACAIAPQMKPATADDWAEEYLDLILAVRIVPNLDAAIAHINRYGSQHSDAIVAGDKDVQERFLAEVDSAAVYANVSTRFTDGAEFGMGAEIGISTDKLHARGPMGLAELTTYKFQGRGKGQIRG
jgi:glutamate-5-semialdehyde dehydrogenase